MAARHYSTQQVNVALVALLNVLIVKELYAVRLKPARTCGPATMKPFDHVLISTRGSGWPWQR